MRRKYATFYYTANPEWDAERYSAQFDEIRPKCCVCGHTIDGDEVFVDDEGTKCESCYRKEYIVSMDDYLDSMEGEE